MEDCSGSYRLRKIDQVPAEFSLGQASRLVAARPADPETAESGDTIPCRMTEVSSYSGDPTRGCIPRQKVLDANSMSG